MGATSLGKLNPSGIGVAMKNDKGETTTQDPCQGWRTKCYKVEQGTSLH